MFMIINYSVRNIMPVRTKYSKKNGKQYSLLGLNVKTKSRTKKTMSGGSICWFNKCNELEVSRKYACEVVEKIIPNYTGKYKTTYVINAQRILHDYLTNVVYRMYKLYGSNTIKIKTNRNMSPEYKLEFIFKIPVKPDKETSYGKTTYVHTDTKDTKYQDRIPLFAFIDLYNYLMTLNNSPRNITNNYTHEQVNSDICKKTLSHEPQYIQPKYYKTSDTSVYTVYGVCTSSNTTTKTIPNIIYRLKKGVDGVRDLLANPSLYKKQKSQILSDYKSILSELKNRNYVEDLAFGLYYASMYSANANTQGNLKASPYDGSSGYRGYGYREW